MTDQPTDFLKEEYKSLRSEQLDHSKQEYIVQRDFVIFLVGFYTVTETELIGVIKGSWIYLLPVLIALLSMLRQQRYTYWILKRAEYFRKCEDYFLKRKSDLSTLGWEKYIGELRSSENTETFWGTIRQAFLPDGRYIGNTNITKYFYSSVIVSSLLIFISKT